MIPLPHRLLCADEHAKQRRFARAVRPDQPDARLRRHVRRGVVKNGFRAEVFLEVVDVDHERLRIFIDEQIINIPYS